MVRTRSKNAKLYGAKVKEYRNIRGISQEKLAELCDCSSQTISGIEIGYNTPSFLTMESIADALEVPLKYFFNFDNDEKMDVEEQDFIAFDLYKKLPDEDKRAAQKIFQALTELNNKI